jgi:hypothetical protein
MNGRKEFLTEANEGNEELLKIMMFPTPSFPSLASVKKSDPVSPEKS